MKIQPFIPQGLPPAELDWQRLIPALGRANRALAGYGGILEALPNPGVLLSPITTQEAVLSSKIEGTHATLGDVLKFEAGEEPREASRATDIQEILNYRAALTAAQVELGRRPFSLGMLKMLHGRLLQSVRGRDKHPGEFRKTQNWIGPEHGCPLEKAAFIPPPPAIVIDHLEAWERYYRSDDADGLAQLAIIHAQFEIIHPFNDGNGRIGRILIPLFLYEKKLLPKPIFYLSAWLDENREDYIAKLRALGRSKDAWTEWVLFFLLGVEEQSAKNAASARAVLELYARLKKQILELTHSQFAVPLLDQAFTKPVFQSTHLKFSPTIPSRPAVANLLRLLKDGKIIKVLREGAGRRPTVYVLAELLNICEGREVF